MTEVHIGGCACGAIRYSASGALAAQLHCQCGQCRKRSGTGHGSFLAFVGEGAVEITGTPSTWSETADSGNEKLHHFCGTCGAPVAVTFPANPAVTALHAGSLDAPEGFAPGFITYTGKAMPWDRMDQALTGFTGMPTG